MSWLDAPVREQAAAVARGEVSPRELVEGYLARIQSSSTNAVVTISDEVEAEAAAAEETVRRGEDLGPLHGVPFTAKDNLLARGLPATAGSLLLRDHVPDRDASAVARFRRAGALLLGKTNCSEFALEAHSTNLLFGTTGNPRWPGLSPGGSSGGEAAALAEGCSSLGIGTDYGGSIRFPAQCTGIVGLRPTIGRVPNDGQLPLLQESSPRAELSMVGPMGRHVDDLRLALAVLAGPAPADPRSYFAPPLVEAASRGSPPAPVPVACVAGGFGNLDEVVARTLEEVRSCLEGAGFPVERHESVAGLTRAAEVYARLRETDELLDLDRVVGDRSELLGEGMRTLLSRRRETASSTYHRIRTADRRVRREVLEFMEDRPILVLPVATCVAPAQGAHQVVLGGRTESLFDVLAPCRAVSLLGFPSLSVPWRSEGGGPSASVQVVGRPFQEDAVLAVGSLLESRGIGREPG